LIPASLVMQHAMHDYRLWILEQLSLASGYLLGPNEPLAGEATIMPPEYIGDSSKRDLAVVVTAAHILLFRIDLLDGQPRWVVLVARPTHVTMEVRNFVASGFLGSGLTVSAGSAQWVIRGVPGVWKPRQVTDAWRTGSAQRLPR